MQGRCLQARLGYKQVLHRSWAQFESFQAAFGSLYFIGGVQYLFTTGIYAGGPAALWSSMLITGIFQSISAASLAEICSAIPLSGSIYSWASCAGGRTYGRFCGFLVAFWSVTAWTSFVASTSQGAMNFILSEIAAFDIDWPTGDPLDLHNIKVRAVQWAGAEILLLVAVVINFLPPVAFKWAFRASLLIMVINLLLTFIWLPIGTAHNEGFQSASWVFTEYYNGTGAPGAWNWILSFLSTGSVLTGFDSAGHIAEETKLASIRAARGIFWGLVASAIGSLALIILYLFCSPDLDTLFSFTGPQPFVTLYQLALGTSGNIILTVVAIIGLVINNVVAIVAVSRLVYAIARDGVFPGSDWIGKVDADGQPRHAVTFVGVVSALLLCTILPSPVAFTSLVSAAAVPTIAAYGLIALLRLTITPGNFEHAQWSCGPFSKVFQVITVIWSGFLTAVFLSPYEFPVTAQNLNYAPVILGGVTIMAILAFILTPEERWLAKANIAHVLDVLEDESVDDKDK